MSDFLPHEKAVVAEMTSIVIAAEYREEQRHARRISVGGLACISALLMPIPPETVPFVLAGGSALTGSGMARLAQSFSRFRNRLN